jgi:carboxyl-terminal processing protease
MRHFINNKECEGNMKNKTHRQRRILMTKAMMTLLTALAMSGCAADSEELIDPVETDTAPTLNGVWLSRGYGRLAVIEEETVYVYDYTEISCIEMETFTLEELGEFTFSNDGNTIAHVLPGQITEYQYDRLDEMPEVCDEPISDPLDPVYNFDVFWQTFKEQYAFFDKWGVNWDDIRAEYRPRVDSDNLFEILTKTLESVEDHHVNLVSEDGLFFNAGALELQRNLPFVKAAHEEQSEIEDFDEFLEMTAFVHLGGVYESYFGDDLKTAANDQFIWGEVSDDIGYLSLLSMEDYCDECDGEAIVDIAQDAMDEILSDFEGKSGLIFDLRFNGGGLDGVSMAIASRFIEDPVMAFQKRAVDGDGFTDNQVFNIAPPKNRGRFGGEVVFLISPYTVSAGEVFLLPMLHRPNTTLVGQTTAGSYSDALFKMLPNGWIFSLSNEIYEDEDGVCYEGAGIAPDETIPVLSSGDLETGEDSLVERAITLLSD